MKQFVLPSAMTATRRPVLVTSTVLFDPPCRTTNPIVWVSQPLAHQLLILVIVVFVGGTPITAINEKLINEWFAEARCSGIP